MRLPTSPISGSAFQERSARRISLMFLVANAIGALAYTVLAGQTQAWQVWALIGLSLALAGIGALSFWWSGRGRYQAGIVALIGATAAGGLLGSALVANVGPLLGIVVVFLSLTVAAQTLPQRMINRVLTLSSLAGLSAVVVNVLAGPTQLSVPQLQSIVPALAVMALLSFGVLIARQFRSYSFSTKLLVTLLSVVALTLGGSAAVTGQAVGRQLVDDTGKRLQSLSESKANEIGRVLQSEIGALRTLTLNKFVQDGLEAASQANPGDPAELRQRNQAWQIAAADSPLVTQVLDNDPASELREFQRSFPDHLLVAATDRWGATVAATNRVEDYYQADQAWWQAALDRGVFISQPEPAAADQPPSLIIALAVPKHDTDVIAGVLYARLSLRIFANTLATGKFGQTGRTEIYLPDGQTLALKVDNPAELVLAPGEIDLATLRQSPDGSLDDVEAGVPYLAGRMPIAAGGAIEGQGAEAVRDMGWYVVARQSRAEALQAGETTTRVTLLVTLGALIAAGLIALFVAQVLTGPIVRLTAVAAQASDGDLAVQAPIEANDEIGVLAATFNQMTVRLRETLGALEQRVAERTTQFEAANRELSARIKDQERMEAALRESAERFQTLFEASPDAIVLIDPHGPWPILDCNSAACQMNGYTREELVGQSIDILNLTRGDAAERAAYLDQLRQSSAFHLRTMHRRKDGTLFPIEVSTSLIMLGGREVVLGIDRDITEQQRAEEALRMSEERFQLVAYATNDAVWDLNLATGQRWWNAGVSSVFGYPPDQVGADQAWWEARLHPDDRDKVLASFQTALLSDGKFWSKEYRYRRADGTYAYVFDRGYIIADSHGRPLRAIGAILDLTERKRAEEEIRAEQQRVQTILETVTVPMVISRLSDSRVLYANQALSQIRRVPLEELIGSRTVDYFVNPDDREKLVDILKRQGYAVDFETQLKRSDGVASWVLLSARIVNYENERCVLTTYVDITERRQTEEALREAEARFRSAFDDAAVGMALVAPSGRWLQVNHALCKLLGYSEQELLAGTFQDITHPDDLQANLDNVRQALDGAVSTYQMQKRYIHKSGRLVWALLSVSLIRNGQGEPLYFVSQIQDITGRHEMEQALRESAARYRQMFEEAERLRQYNATILEVMAEGLAMEDADGRLTFVNPKLLSMLDYTAEELVGQPWTLITAPDERERVAEQASQRRGGVTSLYETRLLAKDGQEIPVLVSATPLLQDGRFAGTLATFMDIAERKRAEAALASSERRFRALVTQAPVGIFEIDIGSGCLFANERWLEMTGLTLPAALGQGWVSALHPDDRDQVLAEWRTAAAAGREFKLEYRLQTPQGKATWVFGSALAIRDEHGKVTGYFGTLTDITERRQNEAALRNMNDQLTVWLAELEQRNKEIALLNRMSELLQSCATVDEACAIIASLAPQLFPEGAGGLCVMHPSHDKVEMVAAWGGAPATQPVFAPDDCWALRRSRPHLVQAGQGAPYCRHVTDSSPATHLCVPLLAQGEALGILYLGRTPMADAPQAEAWQRLAQTVGDNIGLALANLILRETLRNQSIRDPLTGLFNRRYMEESLDRELHRAARSLYPVGIIMLDLDHFKHFNDTFGHAAGDAVLRELGAFLQAHVRGGDIVCRYGGEEFTLILPEAPLEATQGRAQLLCQDIHHFHVEYSGQPLGPVTISAGVAAFPDHGQTAEEVLRAADGALYRAKRGGRDRVMIVE